MSLPPIYDLSDAAELLGVTEGYLRAQLRSRRFPGLKRANRWAMTEDQIIDAIGVMSHEAREPEAPSPAGLSQRSRLRRRIARQAS